MSEFEGFEEQQAEEEPEEERVVREPPFPPDPISEAQEQAIRDHYGYTASEKRTRAQRDAVAAKIKGRQTTTVGVALQEAFLKAYPARKGDLTPTQEQLKKLGLDVKELP